MLVEQSCEEGLRRLMRETEENTYGDKYVTWQEYLHKVSQCEDYLLVLSAFLDRFPFNFVHWKDYIARTSFESYQVALARNPKCYDLWTAYLAELRFSLRAVDPARYKKELEKTIIEIGADTRSVGLYEEYYTMISENMRYEFYKKVFTRALIGLETLFSNFGNWLADLSDEQVRGIYAKQLKGVAADFDVQRKYLYESVASIYHKTVGYRQQRLALQKDIRHIYFDGSNECAEEEGVWVRLIELERSNGVVENISYCYERRLMAQTEKVHVWEEAFHYLQNETNKYAKVLSILRANKSFFLRFNLKLYFYWCDMEERESAPVARKMYLDLEATQLKGPSLLEVYLRHIQLEIREKQCPNAKNIFDTMLGLFQEDLLLLSYILVEYSEFVLRYYKDFEYAKKLLKTYFEMLPYNDYLFTSCLELMKHFQNKEGFYDELISLIQLGLNKARTTLPEEGFSRVIKMIKHFLRSTLSSIYLIKISERRLIENDEKARQQET